MSHSEKRKPSLSLFLWRRSFATTLTAIPTRGNVPFTSRRRRGFTGHSRHTVRAAPLCLLGIVVLVTSLLSCEGQYGVSQETTTPRVLRSRERPRRDDCGREDPRGSAFWSGAAWSGGRSQVAGAAAEENGESVRHLRSGPRNDECCQGVPSARGEAFSLPRRRCK